MKKRMNKTLALVIAVIMLALNLTGCGKKTSDGIPAIYQSQEELQASRKLEEYHPNEEITGEYDSSLAADCENGVFVGKKDERDVKSWKGIPYGKVNARFERAQSPDPSDKVYEAYYFGKSCMQPKGGGELSADYENGDLDTLTLNVWAKDNDIKDKPVLVFIHGGGWINGGTSDPDYNGTNFVYYNPDIVLITITYRFGIMGMINLGVMNEDGTYLLNDYEEKKDTFNTSYGNNILDMIQALRWIKNNVSAFGGDPDNVTISGESAGGGAVSTLVMIASDPDNEYYPHDKNLFRKAIALSGGINLYRDMSTTEPLTRALAEDFGCSSIEDLQNIDFQELRDWWQDEEHQMLDNYCTLDGSVLPSDAYESYNKNVGSNFTVLQGATTNEFSYYEMVLGEFCKILGFTFEDVCKGIMNLCTQPSVVQPDFEPSAEFTEAFSKYMKALDNLGYKTEAEKTREFANDYSLQGINYYQAEKQALNGGTTYIYAFDQPFDGDYAFMKAGHGADIPYLFGVFDGNTSTGTKEEVDLSIEFQHMIAAFCRTGNPSTEEHEWKPYDTESRNCMVIRAGDIHSEKQYQADRISNLVKMFDTNPNMKYFAAWTDVFAAASEAANQAD